jgi:hypothetical protein
VEVEVDADMVQEKLEEEARRRTRRKRTRRRRKMRRASALIKSNNPHLAGGEQKTNKKHKMTQKLAKNWNQQCRAMAHQEA